MTTIAPELIGPTTAATADVAAARATPWSFEQVYEAHFAFVWRTARRLGVERSSMDDVVQDVFVVVHRRLSEVAANPSLASWLRAIVVFVVRTHRRTARRKRAGAFDSNIAELPAPEDARPEASTAKAEACRVLHLILDELDDDKREVFVLAELEQLSAPEIAVAIATNVNTVYARLRAARRQFEAGVARHAARDQWRLR